MNRLFLRQPRRRRTGSRSIAAAARAFWIFRRRGGKDTAARPVAAIGKAAIRSEAVEKSRFPQFERGAHATRAAVRQV